MRVSNRILERAGSEGDDRSASACHDACRYISGRPAYIAAIRLASIAIFGSSLGKCFRRRALKLLLRLHFDLSKRPVSLFFHVLRNEGVELFASGTILFVLEVPRQFASYNFHQVLWRFSLREPTCVIPQLKCIPQINMIA